MTNTFRKIVAVFGLTVLAGGVFACDETADEYHQQEVTQKLSLYNSISGNYVGTITTQGSSCNLLVNLQPSTSTTTSSDGTTSQATAQLQGNVTIDCGTFKSTESVPQMNYFSQDNSNNGTLNGNFPVTANAGNNTTATAQMAFAATLNGSSMSGSIQMTSPAGFTGTFTASLNGTPGQAASGQNNGQVTVQGYQGSYQAPCAHTIGQSGGVVGALAECNNTFTLTTEQLPQEDNDFYDHFATQKRISIQFNSTEQDVGPDGTVYDVVNSPIGFQSATMDLENKVLDGTQSSVGANNGTVTIHCAEVGVNLNCSLLGFSSGTDVTLIAYPAKK